MNFLDRFNKSSIGSNNKLIDFTSNIGSQGDFQKIYDIDVIINSWKNILTTRLGTYIDDPTYGSKIYDLLFQPFDEGTRQDILNEVKERLFSIDDRADIRNLDVKRISGKKGFVVFINVNYDKKNVTFTVPFTESNIGS